MCSSSSCSNCVFKERFLHPLLCALACVILGCLNHALNYHSRGCCSSFPSQTSPLSPSSQFWSLKISGVWESAEVITVQREVSQHMCGYELQNFFIWLRRRENVSWKPETSALVLKIFDEQIGTHSLLLEHKLHDSFQWQLPHTLEKSLLFQTKTIGDEWKKSKWRRRICKIVGRLCKVKNWPHSSDFA